MPSIRSALIDELNEIIMPLPDELGVPAEEPICQNLCGVVDSTVTSGPEAIVSSEGGNATRCAETCTSEDHYILLSK
jgi:hypothetical protein